MRRVVVVTTTMVAGAFLAVQLWLVVSPAGGGEPSRAEPLLGDALARDLGLTQHRTNGGPLVGCDGRWYIEVEDGRGYCVHEDQARTEAEADALACRLRGNEPSNLDLRAFRVWMESHRLANALSDDPTLEDEVVEATNEGRRLRFLGGGACLDPNGASGT